MTLNVTDDPALSEGASSVRTGGAGARLLAVLGQPAVWLALIVFVAIAAGISYVLKLKGYFVMPDELTYQREALYIARHGRPVPAGDLYYNSVSQLAPLVQAPVWGLVDAMGAALDAAHVVNVVVFASSCVPVFLLTSRITGSVPASVLAGGASVAVPWFAMTGTMMTEPVAYPAFCWALLGLQRAVAEPGVRGDILALMGVALAVGARSQLVFLAPVLVAAMLVREGLAARAEGPRAVARRHPVLLAALVLVAAYLILTGKSLRDLVGNYAVTTEGDVVPPGTFAYARELLTSASLACAGITLPLAAGWILGAVLEPRRRQPFAGALVLLLAGSAVVVVAGAFSVRFTAGQNDRYVAYLAPVLFIGAAAALSLRPIRLLPTAVCGIAAAWLYWTSTLAAPGPSLASPGGTFRVVIDGRTRQLADHFGFASAKPTAVVAVLVLLALVAVLVAVRRVPQAAVAVVVGGFVLGYGVAETGYTLHRIDQTQVGASPEFAASRGWADRALPDGEKLNALVGFVADPATTIGTWWDAVFYNRDVDQVYQLSGTPPQQQATHPTVVVDPRTGVLRGLPGGYLLVPAAPVHVGLAGARRVTGFGAVEMVRTGPRPRAAFVLDTVNADGAVPAGQSVRLRVFGDGGARRRRLVFNAVARTGPIRLTVVDAHGRRLASRLLATDVPAVVRISVRASAAVQTLRVRTRAPRRGAVKGALLQALSVGLDRAV